MTKLFVDFLSKFAIKTDFMRLLVIFQAAVGHNWAIFTTFANNGNEMIQTGNTNL